MERVTDEVRVPDDFVALIEVAQDGQAFTEFGFGSADAEVELGL